MSFVHLITEEQLQDRNEAYHDDGERRDDFVGKRVELADTSPQLALAIFSRGRQAILHVEMTKSGPGYGATVGTAPTIRKWSSNNYIVARHVLSTFVCN